MKIGVLSPSSYSEQAGKLIAPSSILVNFNSIDELLNATQDDKVTFSVVPLENLLHGPVTETLDTLTTLHLKSKNPPEIIHSFNLDIEHFLGVPKKFQSIPLNEIKIVYSHPQALSQSEKFLNENLKSASRVSVSSTSIAPKEALNSEIPSAVIASKEALIESDFYIHTKTVPSEYNNKTRFGIISKSKNKAEILNKLSQNNETNNNFISSICIHPGKDRKGLLLEILSLISETHGCNLLSINSRPDKIGEFIFYFEIEGSIEAIKVRNCLEALKNYCSTSQSGSRAQLLNFGSYRREAFQKPLIQNICIVGAKGEMGKWLVSFFKNAGFNILEIDLNSNLEEKKQIKNSDTIIFSVPMRNIESSARELKEFIEEGSLIVENCSVKSHGLSKLKEIFPNSNPNNNYEVLGIHTMFGPDISSLKGNNIIITKTPSSSERAKALEDIFYKYGANLHHASIEEHDKTTAFLQALCQFFALGLADVMHSIDDKTLNNLKYFLTPNSERSLTSVSRVLSQSKELTEDLQTENPYSKEIRELFINNLSSINKSLTEKEELNKNTEELHKKLAPYFDEILNK